MLLQKGSFIVKTFDELDTLEEDKDGLKKVIDLAYMGQVEYEGNAVPLSRMCIEYFIDDYEFFHLDVFNANGEQMIMYANKKQVQQIENIDKKITYLVDRNYSLEEHIKNPNEEYGYNFWWDINAHFFIFFGEEKKELINYFIDSCYKRDGGKELIRKKMNKVGWDIIE